MSYSRPQQKLKLPFTSKYREFESVSKSSAPASIKNPFFT
jgi:hypothetical protein